MMDRRVFLSIVDGSILAGPLATAAQQAGKMHRIGVLTLVPVPLYEDIFRQSLSDHGYVEGRNLTIEWRRAIFERAGRHEALLLFDASPYMGRL